MKQLNINLIVLALGIAFSTGAMALSPLQFADASPVGEPSGVAVESIESAESVALAAAARKKAATDRLDAMYEVAKAQCNIHPVGARAYCLNQMRVGFGK